MRSEPLLAGLACLALAAGCPDEKSSGPAPSRFQGVAAKARATQAAQFCDHVYPASGEGARRYVAAPTRPLAGAPKPAATTGWRWINAWATWCEPCVAEMGLLTRWRDALRKDGADIRFELLSIDAPEAEPELRKWLSRNLPGEVRWMKSEDDFDPWLEGLGAPAASAIPIHALVDPEGLLRCVRLGAVHDQDYGAVRALLSAH